MIFQMRMKISNSRYQSLETYLSCLSHNFPFANGVLHFHLTLLNSPANTIARFLRDASKPSGTKSSLISLCDQNLCKESFFVIGVMWRCLPPQYFKSLPNGTTGAILLRFFDTSLALSLSEAAVASDKFFEYSSSSCPVELLV